MMETSGIDSDFQIILHLETNIPNGLKNKLKPPKKHYILTHKYLLMF